MFFRNDPEERVAIVQLNSELRHAELELLSAQCATERLRLRFSVQDIARHAQRDLLRKAVDIAGSLHHYYSWLGKQVAPDWKAEDTPAKPVCPLTERALSRRTVAENDNGLEYSVVTQAPPDLAWRVFIDCARWPKFSDSYGEIRWIEGEAWQPGSRLLIEVVEPVRIQIDHRITTAVEARELSWIDRGLGTTIEQSVYFEALPEGRTRVRTRVAFHGMARVIAGRPLRNVLFDFTARWYESYRAECDREADRPTIR